MESQAIHGGTLFIVLWCGMKFTQVSAVAVSCIPCITHPHPCIFSVSAKALLSKALSEVASGIYLEHFGAGDMRSALPVAQEGPSWQL